MERRIEEVAQAVQAYEAIFTGKTVDVTPILEHHPLLMVAVETGIKQGHIVGQYSLDSKLFVWMMDKPEAEHIYYDPKPRGYALLAHGVNQMGVGFEI